MKKIVSALLVVMLVFGMLPVFASATEVTATLSFASTAQRVSQTTASQVWANEGITFTNNKGSGSNVANYSNPVRLYQGSEVIIEYPQMTKIEIAVNASKYVSPLTGSTFSSGTVTASGNTVTVTFEAPVDSLTITLKAQVRLNSLTVTGKVGGDTTCTHANLVTNDDAVAVSCTADGWTASQSCVDCGETVVYREKIPALGHNVVDGTCTNCGETMTMYDLVTDPAELTIGSQVIIVAAESEMALGTNQKSNNREAIAASKSGTQVVFNDTIQVLTIEEGTVAGTVAFYTGAGYLHAAGDKATGTNYLRTSTTKDANTSFAITITDGVASVVAQGSNLAATMQYNDSSKLFACYGSASQKAVAIYKLAGTGSEPVECDHPTSTVQDDAVAPTCTTVGFTASEKCDICGATTKFAEEIPALGHDFVDYSCSVCLAIDPASPLTATRIKNQLPANGDKILFYHYSSKVIMSEIFNSYGERLVGVSSAVADGALPYGASAAVLTVGITEDDEFYFVTESGKYLASAEKGNALVLADELDDLSLWTVNALEAGSFNIINNGASYNGTAYDQALEVYNGMFTTYGLQSTAAYQIDIYLVEAAPVCEHTNTKELEDGKNATCTETGLTNTVVCADCGETVTAQTEIPAYGHAWVEQEEVASTCIHAGHLAHFECCVCLVVSLDKETLLTKEEVQLPVNPDAHEWDEGVYTDPTTEADGYTTYTCNLCAETEVEVDEGTKLPSTAITAQPQAVTANSGDTVQFKVETAGEVVSYKWEYRQIWKWFNTNMTGADTDTLTVPVTGARNGYDYRCTVTFADGTVLVSEPAELTVNSTIVITGNPNNQAVALGYKGQFTAAAEGDGIKYAWQYSRNGETWAYTQMEGYTKPTVMIETTTARDGYMYRCEIKDATGAVAYTEVATLTVLHYTTQPADVRTEAGNTVTFSVETNAPVVRYEWQYSKDGEKWTTTSMTGYNTATLTVEATAARDGYQYRCVITGAKDSKAYSKAATLYIGAAAEITAQPQSVTAAIGSTVAFAVEATNVLTYQWQYTKDGTNWYTTSMTGATTNTLEVAVTAGRNGYQYRCQITGTNGDVIYTDAATLTVG